MEPIETDGAPAAIGPYSQGVRAGRFVFASGQLPLTAEGELIVDDVRKAARQALANLSAVLAAGGASLGSVVKVTIYLADMDDFAAVNEVYSQAFSAPYPARATVAVGSLPMGARLEIEAIALVEG